MNTMNVYCCGGAATNIGKTLLKVTGKPEEGFANIATYFVDTSSSNIDSTIPSNKLFLLDGVDGSGKVRSSNYAAAAEHVREILHKFNPGDINVVLHSTGGGSGSVMGPLITSELLNRDCLTIVIMIGSTSCELEVSNTANTLKSYEGISKLRGKPVVAGFYQNVQGKKRSEIDTEVHLLISFLAVLFSGNNAELDTSDLRNLLNYHVVTQHTPKLSLLEVHTGDIILDSNHTLVSVATLTEADLTTDIEILVGYQATGLINPAASSFMPITLPLHTCVINNHFPKVMADLQKKLDAYNALKGLVVEKSLLGSNDSASDEGLIL